MEPDETVRPPRFGSQSPQPSSRRATRVLVADDDVAVGRGFVRMLKSEGFEVVAVNDGASALNALTAQPFDVVLSDVHMPGGSGLDLLRVVRAYDLRVPVLLISGDPELESAMEAVELGAVQYLRKPIQPSALTEAIRRALEPRSSDALTSTRETNADEGVEHVRRAPPPSSMHADDDPSSSPPKTATASLAPALDRALGSMWLAYQPIVSVRGRRVVAYEALLRSDEPRLPDPLAVIEAAERLDRVWEIGRRVRAMSAQGLARAPAGTFLFVKLHAADLLDPELASDNAPLASEAHRVVFEITEQDALDRIADVRARLSILRYIGYRLAIDDLGAGLGTLASFAELEPEFVKLHMSLVRDVHSSPVRQKLVHAVAKICEESGITVVAEGIEGPSERDTVRDLGCDLMQGYLFARPARVFTQPLWA